jgi:glycosyltransferase involved in cell wall biosynthesis
MSDDLSTDDAASRRTLLMLTYNFPPSAASGSHRLLGFARHLRPHGWRTAVVSATNIPFESVDPELDRRVPAGTLRYAAPFRFTAALRPFRRFLPVTTFRFDIGLWGRRATRVAQRVIREQPIAAIVTSGPPHEAHVAGLRLKRRYGLPWIADFRDPWVAASWINTNAEGMPRLWAARMERQVMDAADVIVANAPTARDALHGAFPQHAAKIVTITNGYDPESFDGLDRRPDPEGRWTLAHPGSLYLGRDPRHLFEALGGLLADWPAGRARPRLRLLGGGHGLSRELKDEVSRLGLDDVVVSEGQVPYRDSLQAMVDADVLVLLDTPGRRAGVPAKLYEYLGAGRPILSLGEPDGDTAWVLRRSGVESRTAPLGDPAAIGRALRELAALDPGGEPGPGRLEFTRERLAGRLAELLDRLTGRDGAEVPVPATVGGSH